MDKAEWPGAQPTEKAKRAYILIATDFSPASRHGLHYACQLLQGKNIFLDLLHIYPVPVTYTTDGVALTAIQSGIERAERCMEQELAFVAAHFPGMHIKGRVITGGFLDTLHEETRRLRPFLLILGTAGFADLYFGDLDPLNALRDLPVPVLFIPQGAIIRPIKHMAYAVNYHYVNEQTPLDVLVQLLRFFGADLQVVHADKEPEGADKRQTAGKEWLQERLKSLAVPPPFHWVQARDVIQGLNHFISSSQIDCVAVVPRRYGLWESFFRRSRTKALARLNKLPVLAVHER